MFKKNESLVHITQYPNEYIIETFNSSDAGIWVRSNFVSVKPLDVEIDEIEKLINIHFDSSKKVNYEKYDLKSANENYKKVTKRSSIKKQMENAKQVSIYRKKNLIELTPNINGGTSGDYRGFRSISDKMITLDNNLITENEIAENEIAENVLKLFSDCK
ncbi:hypothetical protein [Flavobacterium channae]|uniref:hypothetical protein n=1 Tax=Flavobacterium channae TaxID=2897181 RepID=UPI001E504FBF|nr:hypothetical protein [Flavobacterium channae]UGS22562.1 hypothetical protein LOS89_07185 [Flavobacterium channae]